MGRRSYETHNRTHNAGVVYLRAYAAGAVRSMFEESGVV